MAVQLEVFGLIDHTHPAAAELAQSAVVRDGLADQGGGFRHKADILGCPFWQVNEGRTYGCFCYQSHHSAGLEIGQRFAMELPQTIHCHIDGVPLRDENTSHAVNSVCGCDPLGYAGEIDWTFLSPNSVPN